MNDIREFDSHDLHQLQRRVARNDARIRMILRGTLLLVVVAGLSWASAALSEPDTPYTDIHGDIYRFTPNTPAVADEINSNFSRLRSLDAVNAEAIADLTVSQINGGRLVNGTVAANHIANGAITASKLATGAVDAQVKSYIHDNCYIYIGWRDKCDGCSSPPSRWAKHRIGRTSNGCDASGGQANCTGGWAAVGADGTNVGNDQFYVQLQCD